MQGMSEIVKNIVRIFVAFTLLFGIYVMVYGHLTPGGGFTGGVIIAGAFVLLCIAFGRQTALDKLSQDLASSLDSLGALVFLALAFLGLAGGYFFLNVLPVDTDRTTAQFRPVAYYIVCYG